MTLGVYGSVGIDGGGPLNLLWSRAEDSCFVLISGGELGSERTGKGVQRPFDSRRLMTDCRLRLSTGNLAGLMIVQGQPSGESVRISSYPAAREQ